jgi:hypothetical protein
MLPAKHAGRITIKSGDGFTKIRVKKIIPKIMDAPVLFVLIRLIVEENYW